jgi:RNA polymerase sigma-70 factor, ECF subfamily
MDAQPVPLVAPAYAGEALEDIVSRAYEAERLTIYRYLVSMRLPPPVAQEITQDVFVKLYMTLRDGTEVRALRTWLFTVASRLFLNWRRDEHVTSVVQGEEADRALNTLADPGEGPEHTLIHRQRLEAVAAAFAGLSPQQQVCLHLRAEGLRYKEIADVLGIAVPTVSEFVRRAVVRLQKAAG